MGGGAASKLKSRDDAVKFAEDLRRQGKKIGFTSGTFDLLHPGHVRYLEAARALCDALVVGVNADQSVRQYKSPLRPVLPEADRALVVAGLAAVDCVFIFDEVNNHRNVELLKPDFYIKAGDYSQGTLSSAGRVEAAGGQVRLVAFEAGYSTSALIDRIAQIAMAQDAVSLAAPPPARGPAVFLDRDGTIVRHVEYLHEPEKLETLPGALEALKRLRAAGYRLVIVTNQPGIGLGYFTREDFYRVNLELLRACGKAGVVIDKVYFCPHSRGEGCLCRKPAAGLVERAAADLNLDLSKSFMVGDTTADLLLARNAGLRSVLVRTGYGGGDGVYQVDADFTAEDLAAAAEWILKQINGEKEVQHDSGQ